MPRVGRGWLQRPGERAQSSRVQGGRELSGWRLPCGCVAPVALCGRARTSASALLLVLWEDTLGLLVGPCYVGPRRSLDVPRGGSTDAPAAGRVSVLQAGPGAIA